MATPPLYYNTRPDQYEFYAQRKLFKGDPRDIETRLSTNDTAIRIIAILAATVFSAWLLPQAFFWTVALLGMAGAAWTAYNNLLGNDPLVEAFHQIVGGKDRFEQLPTIQLDTAPNGTLVSAIEKLKFDQLNHRISRATFEGRNVIVVKAVNRHPIPGAIAYSERSRIFVFQEKPSGESFSRGDSSCVTQLFSSISTSLANEWYAQLNP